MVHEFAHAIHLIGFALADPEFEQKLEKLYRKAMSEGLFKNTYAATDSMEYWAEGVQSWFNCNQSRPYEGIHNHVNTRKELKVYDPELYRFLSQYFSKEDWTPFCH